MRPPRCGLWVCGVRPASTLQCLCEQGGIVLHKDHTEDHSDIIERLHKAIALYMKVTPTTTPAPAQ